MKYAQEFAIILLVSFVGELLHAVIPLPIPASIYGLIIMFTCLELHLIKPDAVRQTGKFLIEIMPLMFIPAAVGLMDVWNLVAPIWLPVLTITVVSTLLVMGVAGRVTQRVIRAKANPTHGEVNDHE